VKSLREFPEMLEARPIVVDPDFVVLGGNMRLKAAQEAGLKEVPVYIASWEEAKHKEFIIKDNLAFGEWDWDMLANEWDAEELGDWGLEIPFEDEPTEGLTDPDDVPEVPEEPITKPGDLWILGNHRLLCGDSTKAEDVERLMDGEKADMVFTDPPYGVTYQSNFREKTPQFDVLKNDDRIITEWLPLVSKHSSGFVFIWTTWKVIYPWLEATKDFASITNMVIWHKPGGGLGDLKGTYSTDHEIALVYNRGSQLTGKRIGSVWEITRDAVGSYLHPTQKPVALAEQAFETTTQKKDLILDLFLGSGSTLIAAEKTGRKCYGMELDPKYCDVIVKRWEDFTGKKAELWKQ
jgi:DNA modification methylase